MYNTNDNEHGNLMQLTYDQQVMYATNAHMSKIANISQYIGDLDYSKIQTKFGTKYPTLDDHKLMIEAMARKVYDGISQKSGLRQELLMHFPEYRNFDLYISWIDENIPCFYERYNNRLLYPAYILANISDEKYSIFVPTLLNILNDNGQNKFNIESLLTYRASLRKHIL